MIKKTIEKLVAGIGKGQIEIYNEFSLQHELGILLRSEFPSDKVQFERNISYFFNSDKFIKKEIDIVVFSPDKSILKYAIELKFPRNGQHPEQMFSFCKDILFTEQLKASGFQKTFLIIFADDRLFYSGNADGIYGYFRQNKQLHGTIQKPTGLKNETVELKGTYQVNWTVATGDLKYAIIEAGGS